jgi:hypothetical protein
MKDEDNKENLPMRIEAEESLSNISKVITDLKPILEKGIDAFTEYYSKKSDIEIRTIEVDDKKHKRSIYLLYFVIGFVFVLCTISVFLNQIEYAKVIVNSVLAVAAGIGIKSMFGKKEKNI